MNVINKKKHRRFGPIRMSFLFGALFCAFLTVTMTGKAFSQVPRGVFCLFPSGKNGKPRTFINPDVDGVSVRQDWAALEPSEGTFDWTYLDLMVTQAASGRKSVLLRIGT